MSTGGGGTGAGTGGGGRVSAAAGSFPAVVALGLATAAIGLVAAGRPWATARAAAPGPREVSVSGTDLAPLMLPLALVALACWGAFLVLRTPGRRGVSLLGVLASASAAVAAVAGAGGAGPDAAALLSDPAAAVTSVSAWPWAGAVALAGCGAAFVLGGLRCAAWPQMSRRYDRTESAPERRDGDARRPVDLWRALDDGQDPTA